MKSSIRVNMHFISKVDEKKHCMCVSFEQKWNGLMYMYKSIPSLTIPPAEFFERVNPHHPGTKKVQNPDP